MPDIMSVMIRRSARRLKDSGRERRIGLNGNSSPCDSSHISHLAYKTQSFVGGRQGRRLGIGTGDRNACAAAWTTGT